MEPQTHQPGEVGGETHAGGAGALRAEWDVPRVGIMPRPCSQARDLTTVSRTLGGFKSAVWSLERALWLQGGEQTMGSMMRGVEDIHRHQRSHRPCWTRRRGHQATEVVTDME